MGKLAGGIVTIGIIFLLVVYWKHIFAFLLVLAFIFSLVYLLGR